MSEDFTAGLVEYRAKLMRKIEAIDALLQDDAIHETPPRTTRKGRAASEAVERQIAICRKMPAEFSLADFARAIGDPKAASNRLTKWKALGWVKSLGAGRYLRLETFGGVDGNKMLADIHAEIAAKKKDAA